jgi:hypothetical protein
LGIIHAGEHDDGDIGCLYLLFEHAAYLEPVHFGDLNVKHDKVRVKLLGPLHALPTISSPFDMQAFAL